MSEHEIIEDPKRSYEVLKVHENHYGSDSNQNKRQSSEPSHSQFPLISETPTSAKSLETRKHLNLNTVVNLF